MGWISAPLLAAREDEMDDTGQAMEEQKQKLPC